MKRIGRVIGVIIASCLIAGIGVLAVLIVGWPTPSLPPLLKDVTAGGGWFGACPPKNDEEARLREGLPLALSPELNARLEREYPPGSDGLRLADALREQGFKFLPSCEADASIELAEFKQNGGGLFVYPIRASVFWKVDQNQKISWTRGFVFYEGL